MFWIVLLVIVIGSINVYAQEVSKADELIGTETRKKNNEELARKRLSGKCVSAKLKNVYQTYQDVDNANTYELCIYDDRLAYINTISTIEQFSIPLKEITSIRCDTYERLTLGRFLLVGIASFVLPKKTYCIVVTYMDDVTGQNEQVLFSTNKKHDNFVNNILIARNRLKY